jgi:VWFA-related protein
VSTAACTLRTLPPLGSIVAGPCPRLRRGLDRAAVQQHRGRLRLAPTQLIAVGLFQDKTLQDFTLDRQKLLNALDHHIAEYPSQMEGSAWQLERYVRTLQMLQKIALGNAAHRGPKNLIWVGGGLPRLSAHMSGENKMQLHERLRRITSLLSDERITLYQVDPSGNPFTTFKTGQSLASGSSNGGSLDVVNPFQGSLEFASLARATGGRALIGRNDIDDEFATGLRDGSSMYTLAYRPTTRDPDTTLFRRIKLTIAPSGLSASTREGYFARDATGKLVGDMLSVLRGTATFSDLPVQAALRPGSKDAYVLRIKVEDRAWIAEEENGPRHTDLLVLASTFDAQNKELDRVVRTFRNNQAAPGLTNFAVNLELRTDPNAVQVRFAVRVDESGHMGSANVVLK